MKRILVLDDDKGILEALEDSLENTGYQVKTITNRRNLFQVIDQFEPDILLLDFLLMDDNGGEICFELKNNPQTAELPIIMVSGYCNLNEMYSIYGCDTYLAKPFGLDELMGAIEETIYSQKKSQFLN